MKKLTKNLAFINFKWWRINRYKIEGNKIIGRATTRYFLKGTTYKEIRTKLKGLWNFL